MKIAEKQMEFFALIQGDVGQIPVPKIILFKSEKLRGRIGGAGADDKSKFR